MKQSFQNKYNDWINLISHLILSKPSSVIALLADHGVVFRGSPDSKQLINEVVELLASTNQKFEDELGKLLTLHIQYRGKEMLDLEKSSFSSYVNDDGDEDEFWGALAKGVIGGIGGLFKKKKRRGGGNAAAVAAAQAASKRQADQAKRDMEMQMQRMREAAELRRKEEAEQRRREDKEKAEVARKKQTNTMFMVVGGVIVLGVIGFVMAKSNSPRPAMSYMQAPPISQK